MGIKETSFSHYTFDAGENKGEAPTFFSKSELNLSRNVENRGNGLQPRFGSLVLNVDGSGFPNPIAGNPITNDIFGFPYGLNNFETFFTSEDKIYKDPVSPTVIKSGLSSALRFDGVKADEIFYMTNGVDPVQYFDPARLTNQTYTAGYDTPGTFTATPSSVGGNMVTGTYGYFVALFDLNTETKSNRQVTPVTATIPGAVTTGSVLLDQLPLDPENRTTSWYIYRLDPTGYYYYRIAVVPYDPLNRQYTDTFLLTGNDEIAPNDNDRPDPADVMCLHENVMVYAKGNVVTWSKNFRYQNVPTYNRETLKDSSNAIVRMISFRKTLIIWKTDSIWIITGDLNGSYKPFKISGTLGTLSPKTVQETPQGVFFLDNKKTPRLINSTDFDSEDLRESTDISYKYRKKFSQIPDTALPYCFALLWEIEGVSQYRMYVSTDVNEIYPKTVFVFDLSLSSRNRGDSAWFTFAHNIVLTCAAVVKISSTAYGIHAGDDFGLLWVLNVAGLWYDGDQIFRPEGSGTITIGVNTINCSILTMGINQCRGLELILYNQFTYQEIFRSKILSNTATQFTLADTIPTLPTADPAVCVGGYLTYFATAHFTNSRAKACAPFRMSLLFGIEHEVTNVQFFTQFDFNEVFNFTQYVYPSGSLTPLADNYDIRIGNLNALYDTAVYDVAKYGGVQYDTAEFPLYDKYWFKHVSWGLITREPSSPFTYLGGTLFYQPQGLIGTA